MPNATATALRYKPTVTVFLAEPQKYLPEATGPSTTIPDPVLGGTFTFSAGTDVDWMTRIVYSTTDVVLGPLAAPADTTPPVLSLPADKSVEATSSAGANVAYTATASDDVDPSPTVTCKPPSGSMFPLGATTVTCTATDASGNSATGSFTITVVDTTAPTLTLPANKVVDATRLGGAVVSYTATATDTVDPRPAVSCSPPSGSTFAIGATTVSCKATDASGNAATATFVVHVKGAAGQLADLAVAVEGVGPGKSLSVTVAIAQWFVAHGQPQAACLTLTAFNLEVRAQSGKKIPAVQAGMLIADANRIKSVLDCTK